MSAQPRCHQTGLESNGLQTHGLLRWRALARAQRSFCRSVVAAVTAMATIVSPLTMPTTLAAGSPVTPASSAVVVASTQSAPSASIGSTAPGSASSSSSTASNSRATATSQASDEQPPASSDHSVSPQTSAQSQSERSSSSSSGSSQASDQSAKNQTSQSTYQSMVGDRHASDDHDATVNVSASRQGARLGSEKKDSQVRQGSDAATDEPSNKGEHHGSPVSTSTSTSVLPKAGHDNASSDPVGTVHPQATPSVTGMTPSSSASSVTPTTPATVTSAPAQSQVSATAVPTALPRPMAAAASPSAGPSTVPVSESKIPGTPTATPSAGVTSAPTADVTASASVGASSPSPSPSPSPMRFAASSLAATVTPVSTVSPVATAETPLTASATAVTSPSPTGSPTESPAPLSPSPTRGAGVPVCGGEVPGGAQVSCTTNTSMTTSTSGPAASSGVRSQTTLGNSQTSSVVAGGGTGPVRVENSSAASVSDQGAATSQTGLTDAQGAPATSKTGPASPPTQNSSQTVAVSGGAAAIGVASDNRISNSTVATVGINGTNQAPVSVKSSNQVGVRDDGKGSSTSGSSIAVGGPATTTTGSSTVATASTGATASAAPSPTGPPMAKSSTSPDVSATGLAVSNAGSAKLQTVASPTAVGTLTVSQSGQIAMTNQGYAVATSDATCAGATCPVATVVAGQASPADPHTVGLSNQSTTLAVTGNAVAQGVVAKNVVNTKANVNVHIGGANYGPIHILIQAVTNIINAGAASATSGDANATGGVAAISVSGSPGGSVASASFGETASSAKSGSVQATGAVVNNHVAASSATSIHVPGDNNSAIRVLVQFLVTLANVGTAVAQSGDAWAMGVPSSGRAGQTANEALSSAQSGGAMATGLRVQNTVDLQSDVNVGIDGSNYAPIDIFILFNTLIQNTGDSKATTGTSRSVGATASLAAGESVSQSNSASRSNLSGPADQATSANTLTVGSGTTAVQMNASLAKSQSGNAVGQGVRTSVTAINQQVSTISDPGAASRTAINLATYNVQVRGTTSVTTGPAYIGPVPATTTPGTSGSNGSGNPSLHVHPPGPSGSHADAPSSNGSAARPGNRTQLDVSSTVTDLLLWLAFPDPAVPPMPSQMVSRASTDQGSAEVSSPEPPPVRAGVTSLGTTVPPAAESVVRAPARGSTNFPLVHPSGGIIRSVDRTGATAPVPARDAFPAIWIAVIVATAAALATVAWRRRFQLLALFESVLGSLPF